MEVAVFHSFPVIGELVVLLQPSVQRTDAAAAKSKLSGDETRCPEQLQPKDI